MKKTIYTIGHSVHPIEEFMEILRSFGIQELVDVRTIPKSRRNPQYNSDALRVALERNGISYLHMKDLGGLRHAKKDSMNTGWRNASFRGYADYMGTEEFADALRVLEDVAEKRETAIMCAEVLPWRCHRSLIADALSVHGWEVCHIMRQGHAHSHRPTPFLRVRHGMMFYPGEKVPVPASGR